MAEPGDYFSVPSKVFNGKSSLNAKRITLLLGERADADQYLAKATNKWLAGRIGSRPTRIPKWIDELKAAGIITGTVDNGYLLPNAHETDHVRVYRWLYFLKTFRGEEFPEDLKLMLLFIRARWEYTEEVTKREVFALNIYGQKQPSIERFCWVKTIKREGESWDAARLRRIKSLVRLAERLGLFTYVRRATSRLPALVYLNDETPPPIFLSAIRGEASFAIRGEVSPPTSTTSPRIATNLTSDSRETSPRIAKKPHLGYTPNSQTPYKLPPNSIQRSGGRDV